MKVRLMFTKEQIAFIKKFYRKFEPKYVAEGLRECFDLDCRESQARSFIHNHGIQSGRNGCFPKGHKPWNAGTKGKGICKGNSGNFKKGDIPANLKPLWSERVDKDGYIWMKVTRRDPYTGAPTRYMQKHTWLWESLHGKIPKGQNLIFKDGNRQNVVYKNLMLVTDAELMEANGRQGFGKAAAEHKEAIIAISKIRVKIKSLTKGRRKV